MTQHLTTFNKILFTEGDFSGRKKCTYIVFGRSSTMDPSGTATMLFLNW